MITLLIDTSHLEHTTVALHIHGDRYEKTSSSKILKSQTVLPLIEEILEKHAIKLTDIESISVVVENGSYTGMRVGATVANTLGYLLNIPVNGKKTIVTPVYS